MCYWKNTVNLLKKLLFVQLLTVAFQLKVNSGQSEKPVYLPEFSLQGTDGRIYSNKDFRCRNNQITVADLTGVAVQDIQIAKAVYKEYKELKNEI